MGAVSALLFASECLDSVQCLLLDSPFCSISQVVEDIASSYKWIPKVIGNYVYSASRKQIIERLGFDIENIDPLKAAKK